MGYKFSPGASVMTRNAFDSLNPTDVAICLERHLQGDWGEVCEEDALANEEALVEGDRVLSAYQDRFGTKFWIITESDRSATTVLLPSDY